MFRPYVLLLLGIVLLGGTPLINGQTSSGPNHVVINELDINPTGDDAKSISEWVELYNPTSSDVDIGSWQIASTTILKKTLTVPSNTIIKSGQFLTFSYQSAWLTDVSEIVELRDKNGVVIDKTPLLSDLANDINSWQRTSDGFDTDASSDWKFTTSNAGAPNGKIAQQTEQESISLIFSSDSSSYVFGQTAIISGTVSKQVFTEQPYFHQEPIILTISGPSNYMKTVTLYPDLNLGFKTSLSLQKVLGINEGTYDISAAYAGISSQISFIVGEKLLEEKEAIQSLLTLSTDKQSYLPGQLVTITGSTTEKIPLAGLKFKVIDARGTVISTGSLYPDVNSNFKTTMFVTTVNPAFGQYKIIGEYGKQSALATFEVAQDIKEDKIISLSTDRDFYAPGDTVTISGRLNKVWINSLDLEVIQTKNLAIGTTGDISGSGFAFKIIDIIRISGDGTFSYSFKIPDNNYRLGDYRIKVSKEVGSATKSISVVTNPGEQVLSSDPISLSTDKSDYVFGDTLNISGRIANPDTRSSFETKPVTISISKEDGSPLEIIGVDKQGGAKTREKNGLVVAYEFTAIPEFSGKFSTSTSISRLIFAEGIYQIKATYGNLSKSSLITILDPLKTDERIVTSINKQVFGLNESMVLTGLIPVAAEKGVQISLIKPDGSRLESGAVLDNSKFSWTWQTPISEVPGSIQSNDRSKSVSNYGVYKIHIISGVFSKDVLFKVSQNPEIDVLDVAPLSVSTEKPIYRAGEKLKVLGDVLLREQGNEGLVIPDRIGIQVIDGKSPFTVMGESQVYANQGGHFESIFELPLTKFPTGQYTVSAKYLGKSSKTTFGVVNDVVTSSKEPLSLLVHLDKEKYTPGDTVFVTGGPSKLVYLEKYDVSIIKKSESQITCGSFYCGKHQGPITTIRPNSVGSFGYEYRIPDTLDSLGSYEITVDVGFDTKSVVFDVIEKPKESPEVPSQEIRPKTIEKFNRLSDANIAITAKQKEGDGMTLVPHLIQGSLVTIPRGDESKVNLNVTTDSGLCVIGIDDGCLVTENTRSPGSIYKMVEINGANLKIRYSGSDAEIEKFTIVTETSDGVLPDMTWNVTIQKDSQTSRFYYKINYLSIE